jgi:hypothetical protein
MKEEILDAVKKLIDLSGKAGTEVWDIIQKQAITYRWNIIVWSILAFVVFLISLKCISWSINKYKKDKEGLESFEDSPWGIAILLSCSICMGSIIFLFINLSQIPQAIINPIYPVLTELIK